VFGNLDESTDLSRSRIVIELEHSKIHYAQAYQLQSFVEYTGITPRFRLFRTGNRVVHFKEVRISSQAPDFLFQLFENPTITALGTEEPITPYNRATLPDPCGCATYSMPTVTDNGLLIDTYYLPGGTGTGQTTSGDSQGAEWEFVLRPNTDYLLRGQRLSGTGTTRALFKYKWYLGSLGKRQDPLVPWTN
jgi:hypothetical protein